MSKPQIGTKVSPLVQRGWCWSGFLWLNLTFSNQNSYKLLGPKAQTQGKTQENHFIVQMFLKVLLGSNKQVTATTTNTRASPASSSNPMNIKFCGGEKKSCNIFRTRFSTLNTLRYSLLTNFHGYFQSSMCGGWLGDFVEFSWGMITLWIRTVHFGRILGGLFDGSSIPVTSSHPRKRITDS